MIDNTEYSAKVMPGAVPYLSSPYIVDAVSADENISRTRSYSFAVRATCGLMTACTVVKGDIPALRALITPL